MAKTKFDQIVIVPVKGVKIPTAGKLISENESGIVVEAEVKKGRGRGAVVTNTLVKIPHGSYAYYQAAEVVEAPEAEEKPRRGRKVKAEAEEKPRRGRKAKTEEKPKRHRRTKAEMAAARAEDDGEKKPRRKRRTKAEMAAARAEEDGEKKPRKVKKGKKAEKAEKPSKKMSKKERKLLKKKNKKSAISNLLMDGELD